MNGTNFLADTNALIYLLNGNQCMSNYLQKNLYVSVISEMELLSYSGITADKGFCQISNLTLELIVPVM